MQQERQRTMDELWAAAAEYLPEFSIAEQQAGLALLALLSEGAPVSAAQLAQALEVREAEAERYLRESRLSLFVHSDDDGSVLGFFGLSTVPTGHRFVVNGRDLWTWCAADTLFLPELLGVTAVVESADPVTGEAVELTVSPDGIESLSPEGIVVSMNSPEAWDSTAVERLIATACHFIYFFGSSESGRQWMESHPSTVLLSLDEALAFGRCKNKKMFGAGPVDRDSVAT